jgi:GTPase-associated protein 1, N-terminal domain type 2
VATRNRRRPTPNGATKDPNVLIEQAIFTSAETDHAVGYHLVARSPGVDEADARELSVWGPSHDSLASSSVATALSINSFRLPSGAYCVSKTQLAGEEYSGRGLRTYTHCLLVPPTVLVRFANNPFALLRAAWAKGLLKVCDSVPTQLVPFQLAGRAAPVDEGLIGQLIEQCGASGIGRLIDAVLGPKPVVLIGVRKPEATVAGLLNLLPLSTRGELSFSTGLKFSQRRPFHLLIASEQSADLRRLFRQQLVEVVDVSPPVKKSSVAEFGGWGGYVVDCITSDAFSQLFEQLRDRQEGLHMANLRDLGDHLRRELPTSAADVRSRSDLRKRESTSAHTSDALHLTNGASAADDDFLAMLLSPDPRHDNPTLEKLEANGAHSNGEMRQLHMERLKHRQALSILMEIDSPETIERLEKLDDVVYDAMAGDTRALEEMARLWPQLVAELGAQKLEESREQYLRYSLSIWESCLEDGLREPERAIASLHVLSILFGER